MIGFLFTGAGLRIAGIVAVILILISGFVIIRNSGVNAERNKNQISEMHDVETSNKTRSDINGLNSDDVDSRLHQYQR